MFTPYPMAYQQAPYYPPPVPDQLTQLRQQPFQAPQQAAGAPPAQTGTITWVQGVEGAKAYPVAPGATVLLMDSDGSSFYLKTADASGMPMPLRTFDFTERSADTKPQPAPDWIARLEALEREVFAQPAGKRKKEAVNNE